MSIYDDVDNLLNDIVDLEINQQAIIRSREQLEKSINELEEQNKLNASDLDIVKNAIAIIQEISDSAVEDSYKFIEENLNLALERVFVNSVRKIKLVEGLQRGKYPQLDIQLTVEGGVTRTLKNSGHGLQQMISFMCILCIIAITGSRRLLLMDEILSGLSAESRKSVTDIMWAFASIGFQFIVCEHGFIPKGAHVVSLEMKCGISGIKEEYIEQNGVYLDGKLFEQDNISDDKFLKM